ncbi:response regulator [Candidatus Omnitrophota bacterium]
MKKKKILVIDDEIEILETTKKILDSARRYEVRTEISGTRAVDVAIEFMPDLILLDVAMPEMDGGQVASQIRANKYLENIPIIFVTGLIGEEEVVARKYALGKQTYIAKPYDIKQLLECVEENLAKE